MIEKDEPVSAPRYLCVYAFAVPDILIPNPPGPGREGRGQVRDPDRLTYNLDEEEADDIQSDEEY